jgi:holliday junction DNA helicase RuvA
MIAYIDGKLAFKSPTYVVIDTHGIGYQIKISLNTYSQIPDQERCKLHTYLHIKEDAHTLFGFADNSEKKLFMDLISVSGVGPGTAIVILSYLSPKELADAIIADNVKTIQSIKGIGAKTAQRIILELKDKIKRENLTSETPNIIVRKRNTLKDEALTALTMLGVTKSVAEKNLETVLKKEGEDITLEDLIKHTLKIS